MVDITDSSAFNDASSSNESERSVRIFTDLNLNFTRHPVTGDVSKLTDVEAIKRSVRNLVQTNFYERPFHPEIGSNIRRTLFEPVSPMTANLLSRYVEDVIVNFEPRVELANVICIGDIDGNQYEVVIEFYIRNVPVDLQTVNLYLERLR